MTTKSADLERLALPRATWDDLRFPATAVNPPGLASDPDWDGTKGGWLFASNATELLYIIAQLPHSWAEGTEIRPHVHWEKTTSAGGTVYWNLNYQITAIGGPRSAAVDLGAYTSAQPSDTADIQQITPLGPIDMTGYSLSCMLIMQLSRVHDNANDTYGADARLLEFDFHVQSDHAGSAGEYTK